MDLHKTKLNRAFELLAKIRDFISKNLLWARCPDGGKNKPKNSKT